MDIKNDHRYAINLNVRGIQPSATLRINELSNQLRSEGKDIIKLGLGQSPFPVPDRVVDALKEHAHEKDYLPVKGLKGLREAIAGYINRSERMRCTWEDVLIGPGSKELLFMLQLAYYGDLLIPRPSWVSYAPQARIIGRSVHWLPTHAENNWQLTAEELDIICRDDPSRPRILILNYPSNPTGCTYTDDQLLAIANVARKYKLILLSDEIYGEVHFEGKHKSIARYYPEGTIISTGLSKWAGAGGWRLGTFIFPPELRPLQDAMAIIASETYTAQLALLERLQEKTGGHPRELLEVDERVMLRAEVVDRHEMLPRVRGEKVEGKSSGCGSSHLVLLGQIDVDGLRDASRSEPHLAAHVAVLLVCHTQERLVTLHTKRVHRRIGRLAG